MSACSPEGATNDAPVGYFTYTVADDHWAWSTGIFSLHGYEPGQVDATTELVLQHVHPDDRVKALNMLETVIRTARPFSCYHRIVDAGGGLRNVLSVGRGISGATGDVEQVTGFFADLTDLQWSTPTGAVLPQGQEAATTVT